MGKGSLRRPTNSEAYESNWDKIFSEKKPTQTVTSVSGHLTERCCCSKEVELDANNESEESRYERHMESIRRAQATSAPQANFPPFDNV